ncbi:ROK family protein [Bulleidia sp. zg-1006]|uniref:ROK family protein n=1 Tax=Bulleidia sp. zg-1006 TaxID=2806552 RepID=UPI001939FCAA|nr:ROK family protein [Bulleidia sp. zg-1006]QRG87483.1 ROK family protein [Bulleidia sp. zg-1006]
MKTYIGIDLGGTNVRVAKVSETGEILASIKSASYGNEGVEKVLSNLKSLVREIPNWKNCIAIGIGVPGPVNTKTGAMNLETNLPGFQGYPLAGELKKEFGMPVFIDNDANVAALAEAMVGAGKDFSSIYYVTISTGIGGAFVWHKQVISGSHGFGGEIANIIVDRNREKINYLNVGAIENEDSGTAIVRKGKALFPQEDIQHAGQVFQLAKQANPDALKLKAEIVRDLGQLFATISCVVDPEAFVLGGGVMKSADLFFSEVIESFKTQSHTFVGDTPFLMAECDEPGVIGAAMLPMSQGL